MATPVTLNIWAAASLANVLNDPGFQSALFAYSLNLNHATNINALNITADSSGKLADQIISGPTRPDVFFSAAEDQMGRVAPTWVASADVKDVLRNNLVLIKNRAAGLPTPIISFGQVDAAHTVNVPNPPNTITVQIYLADTETYKVPAGYYAQQAFEYFGNLDWIENASNVTMSTMENVTAVLNAVASSNNASAIGAVYFTDAASFQLLTPPSNPVEIIAIAPSAVNDTIIYPAAPLTGSPNFSAAQDFVAFVQTSTAWTYFLKWGFIPLNSMS